MNVLFRFRGKVKEGVHRGKLLGFPTANIALHNIIPEGIYVAVVIIDGMPHQAATFVGSAKTFGESDYKAESYLLDFDKNIYGQWVTISLLKKLRGNKKFSSKELLIAQIQKDVLDTRAFFDRQ